MSLDFEKSDSLRRSSSPLAKFAFRAIRLVLAIFIAFAIIQFEFEFIDFFGYDLLVRFTPTPPVSNHIKTVAIVNSTVDDLKRIPNISDHTKFLENLKSAEPKFILYLLRPQDLMGTKTARNQFAKIADTIDNLYFLTDEVAIKGEKNPFQMPPPFQNLKILSAPKTSDKVIFAKDGVTRRLGISYQEQELGHLYIASFFNPTIKDKTKIRGVWPFLDSEQAFISFHPNGTYPAIAFEQILNGTFSPSDLKDKIIIVGEDLGRGTKEYISTPYSREIEDNMTTIEMHANMIDTLISNSARIPCHKWVDILFTIFISIIAVYVVLSVPPVKGLFIVAATIISFLFICYFTFWPLGYWIRMAHPLLAAFICYYLFIPYRLIMENRRSWEYYQKNKLLMQVEELKTNFISMMSHDLKTPLARIQGMADVILTDTQPLSIKQKEAVSTIRQSSVDLTNFITRILNFGRIESQGVKLNLHSKDLNALIIEAVNKHEHLAKSRNIEIKTELEPMFSMKVDPDLIIQVLANLIENAIKYSPDNSRILVSSEEIDNFAVVQVADQGMGIPDDEIGNIFMKFFRSNNAKASPIKGSGLGLYLAKYFVELHNGKISVESATGQGTTFTIELPVDTERKIR